MDVFVYFILIYLYVTHHCTILNLFIVNYDCIFCIMNLLIRTALRPYSEANFRRRLAVIYPLLSLVTDLIKTQELGIR